MTVTLRLEGEVAIVNVDTNVDSFETPTSNWLESKKGDDVGIKETGLRARKTD
mgnify:FL=1|jgi:hypothetical protein